MNVKKAIKILRERAPWYVAPKKVGKNLWELGRENSDEAERMTSRELINLARVWTSDNNQRTAIKRNVKSFGKSKNRRATRDALQKGDFDSIPQEGRVKDEDIWSWD